jgi:hypothetical protein
MRYLITAIVALTCAAFTGCGTPGAGGNGFEGGPPNEDAAQSGTYSGDPITDIISSAPRAIITPADTLTNVVVGDVPGMGSTVDAHLGPNLAGYHLTGTAKYIGGYNTPGNEAAFSGYNDPDNCWNLTSDGMYRWELAFNGATGNLVLVVRQGSDPGAILGEWVLTNHG